MNQAGTDQYLEELARAEPDVKQTVQDRPPPPPPLPSYAARYMRAFNALRDDRSYTTAFRVIGGAHGIPIVTSEILEMPIAFSALDRYAQRHGISVAAFPTFVRLVTALDDEYRAVLAEQRAGNTQINEETE